MHEGTKHQSETFNFLLYNSGFHSFFEKRTKQEKHKNNNALRFDAHNPSASPWPPKPAITHRRLFLAARTSHC